MFALAKRYHHINCNAYQGILEFAIVREYDQFQVKFSLYKFREKNKEFIEYLSKNIKENSTRLDFLKRVDNELTDVVHFKYLEIENILPNLKYDVEQCSKTPDVPYQYNLGGKLNIVLTGYQMYRIYNDLFSFFQHYITYENIFKLVMIAGENNQIVKPEKTKKISETVQQITQKEKVKESLDSNVEVFNAEVSVKNKSEEPVKTVIDEILDLFINNRDPIITNYIYHLIMNYYSTLDNKYCSVKLDDGIINITIPNIFPDAQIFSNEYFKYFCQYLTILDVNTVTHLIGKLIGYFETTILPNKDKHNSLVIMTLSFISLCYAIRLRSDSIPDIIESKLYALTSMTEYQNRFINNYIKIHLKKENVQFNIYELEYDNYINSDFKLNDDLINQIKENYSYLINISEEDFLKKALEFVETKQTESEKIDILPINNKKIINMNELISSLTNFPYEKSMENFNKFLMLEEDNKLTITNKYSHSLISNIKLDTNNNIYTTPLYKCYMQYLNNKDSYIVLKNKYIKEYTVSNPDYVTIINMFPKLDNIFNSELLKPSMISTLDYYKILENTLENTEAISNNVFLIIIFSLIIPYYMNNYNQYSFIDYFL